MEPSVPFGVSNLTGGLARAGVDPNDVGDQDWGGPALDACTARLFPHLTRESVVLELGPGSGRYTRHVLPRCREMVLVDYSKLVCEWLSEYLKGKGRFRVHHIDRPALPMIEPRRSISSLRTASSSTLILMRRTSSFRSSFAC